MSCGEPNVIQRFSDGSAGDADYSVIGTGYRRYRQPEPRIAAMIHRGLGDARTVLNVGAGAGAYEPLGREVTAIEPSASMRQQRPAHLVAALDGVAEELPFDDRSFDASMATFTVHQWKDLDRGLREMRRVTRGPVLVLTCDPSRLSRFWLDDYVPEVTRIEAQRYPAIESIQAGLGDRCEVWPVPIPLDCADGFGEAYYGRPEWLLDPAARRACSAWSFIDAEVEKRFSRRLGSDIADGTWDRKFGHLRTQAQFEGSLMLIVGRE